MLITDFIIDYKSLKYLFILYFCLNKIIIFKISNFKIESISLSIFK